MWLHSLGIISSVRWSENTNSASSNKVTNSVTVQNNGINFMTVFQFQCSISKQFHSTKTLVSNSFVLWSCSFTLNTVAVKFHYLVFISVYNLKDLHGRLKCSIAHYGRSNDVHFLQNWTTERVSVSTRGIYSQPGSYLAVCE